jgi:Xaa-Pro aminopeptidase
MNLSEELTRAQHKAAELFAELERLQLIRAGESEESISQAIFDLAERSFGTRKHWHRRLVRCGPNTRLPFAANVPDRRVEGDDIVSIDLGPVFEEYEADFGRSYVMGSDPDKLRLRDDLRVVFDECRAAYLASPSMTGAELYDLTVRAAAARGWGFGGSHAGHLVGVFPISRAVRDAAANRIRPDNAVAMNALDEYGKPRHWILEVHLLDPTGAFGGFFEDLLNV